MDKFIEHNERIGGRCDVMTNDDRVHKFINLERTIQQHWLYKEKRKFSKYEAWIDLIFLMNWSDGVAPVGNQLIPTKRGQKVTSVMKLADHWGWSRDKTKTFLNRLEAEGMLHIKTTTKYTLLTVVNYDFYQGKTRFNRQQNDINPTSSRHQSDTNNKEVNKELNKEVKDTSDSKSNNSHIETEFNDWWNLYNKKVGKKKSETKFKSLRKTYELDVIVNGTKDYLKTITDKQYQKHPYTFLNGEHFNDEYSPNQYSNYPNGDSTDDVDIDDMLNKLYEGDSDEQE